MKKKQTIVKIKLNMVKQKTQFGSISLNNLLAKGGKTQLAKFAPKKMKETCLLDIFGIFELSHVIPEPN